MSIDFLTLYKLIVFTTVIYVSWICYYYPEQYRHIQKEIRKNTKLN
jgi:hypothetical protein